MVTDTCTDSSDSSRLESLRTQAVKWGRKINAAVAAAQQAQDQRIEVYRTQLADQLDNWYQPLLSDLRTLVDLNELRRERTLLEERLAHGMDRYAGQPEGEDLFIGLLDLYTVLYDATEDPQVVRAKRLDQIDRLRRVVT